MPISTWVSLERQKQEGYFGLRTRPRFTLQWCQAPIHFHITLLKIFSCQSIHLIANFKLDFRGKPNASGLSTLGFVPLALSSCDPHKYGNLQQIIQLPQKPLSPLSNYMGYMGELHHTSSCASSKHLS